MEAATYKEKAGKRLLEELPKADIRITLTVKAGDHPPCILKMFEELKKHQNLPHHARWYLATYLTTCGVSEKDIMDASRFGKAIVNALEKGEIDKGDSILKGLGAVKVDPNNIRFEQVAHHLFLVWGKILRAVGKQGQMRRLPFLILFIVFLSGMILISLPFTVIFNIFVNRLRNKEIAKKVEYFEQPSGSSTDSKS